MIIGHEEVISDLQELSEKNELSHGYIFFGPRSVGKRTTALALANFLEKKVFDAPAAGEVLQDAKVIDLAFMKQLDPDVKNSIGIDASREVKNFLWQKPNASVRRTLIMDDAELMTTEAQNALLKIAEEPPESSLLLIITSDIESLMSTIQSRLQKIYFGAIEESMIAKWLTKDQGIPATKAVSLAKRSLGKPGLAVRLTTDETLQKNLELAEKFLKTAPASRKDFIKKLIEPDEFSLRSFLDAVIMNLAWETPSKQKAALWHKTLGLYDNVTNFGLNPRLQLESLLM